MSTTMNGNLQSFSTYQGPTEPTSAPQWNAVRVHDGVNRMSSIDGVLTETADAANGKGHAGELNPYHGTDSIFATARSPNGLPVTEILPSTLVEIAGVQAPVSFWVSEGILQKQADGSYGQTEGKAEAAPEDTAADFLPLDAAAMGSINQALAEVPQGNLDSIMAVATGVAIGRIAPGALAQKFAQASGLSIEESSARVATITAAFQGQTEQALMTRSGLTRSDIPEFMAWAKATHQGALQEAVSLQMMTHNVSGFAALAEKWFASVPPSVAALKAAGIPSRVQGNGTEILVRGQWMSPKAAAKAGLI